MKSRKSLHLMQRDGLWWKGGQWHPTPVPGSCNQRRFKTLAGLERAYRATPPPCDIHAHYYYSGKRGKGWVEKWYAEKTETP